MVNRLVVRVGRVACGKHDVPGELVGGVIGILAARIRERWHRPVIAFAPGEEAGLIKGSARSIPGLHIRDALERVAATHPGLLEKFGGHAMAAGMSLRLNDLEAFSRAFDQEVRRQIGADALQGLIHSDGPLDAADLSLASAQLLRDAGPWGQAFPEPLFTPTTISRFTWHDNGAVYGAPDKQLDGTTHLANVFLCGTDQGFVGIIGAMMSGISMANMHCLRD